MMPEPKPLPPHIPFAPAKSLIVALLPKDHGKVDFYIDDTVTIGPYLPGIIPRLAACILLSSHLVFRPLSKFEPIPRNKAAAVAKLISEGGLEETKQILGWLYDTRHLLISLPDSKNTRLDQLHQRFDRQRRNHQFRDRNHYRSPKPRRVYLPHSSTFSQPPP